jgi:hypothetical protein
VAARYRYAVHRSRSIALEGHVIRQLSEAFAMVGRTWLASSLAYGLWLGVGVGRATKTSTERGVVAGIAEGAGMELHRLAAVCLLFPSFLEVIYFLMKSPIFLLQLSNLPLALVELILAFLLEGGELFL